MSIANPPVIEIKGTQVAATSYGKNNGRIDGFDIIGGTLSQGADYTIEWFKDGNKLNSIDTNNLLGGNYTISVTDSKQCSKSRDFFIDQPQELTVTLSDNTTISCFGGTGGLKSKVEGGTAGYSYVWQKKRFGQDGNPVLDLDNNPIYDNVSGQSAKDAVGLFAGTYRLVVTDSSLPVSTAISADILLDQNSKVAVSHVETDVNCMGGDDGTITFTISGGTPKQDGSYTVIITDDKDPANVISDRTKLKKGDYFFTVTDALGCSFSTNPIPFTIGEPSSVVSINPTIIQKQPSTPTSFDGEIQVSGAGGTGSYTYTWFKGTTLINPNPDPGNTGKAVGLDNGSYYVTVTDANGCPKKSGEMVLSALTVQRTTEEHIKCFGKSTGSITGKASGGLGSGYTYNWYKIEKDGSGNEVKTTIPGITFTEAGQELTKIIDLEKGVYRLVVNENQTPSVSFDYELTQPAKALTVTENKTDVNCAGGKDGTAVITVSDGTPKSDGTYFYAWTRNGADLNEITTNSSTTLEAGDYKVTVTDANGCEKSVEFKIIQPNPIEIPDPTITNVLIFEESTGEIKVPEIINGNGGFTYSWTSSTHPDFTSDKKDIAGLAAGFYTLVVKDAKNNVADNAGCIAQRTFEVTQNSKLIVSVNQTQPILCYSYKNGEITATVSGAVPSYTYEWYEFNGNTSLYDLISTAPVKVSGLGIGKYKLTVRDHVNASKDVFIDLSEPDELIVTLDSKVPVLCYGKDTGAINITVKGGITPYTYEWKKDKSSTTYAAIDDLAGLFAGTYDLVVKDDNGCEAYLNDVIISQPTDPLVINDVEVKHLTGYKTQNGVIEVNITGGTPAYKYEWTVKGNTTVIGTAPRIAGLEEGTYLLNVTDQYDCPIQKEFTLEQPPRLDITGIEMTVNTEIKCYGDETAELTATIIGGVPPYIYKWYNEETKTKILSTTNTVVGLGAGKYIVDVTDQEDNTLYGINEFTISQPDPLAITSSQTEVSCKKGDDGTISLTITGGSSDYSIIWDYDAATNNGKTHITDLPFGTYNVTVSDNNAVDCFIKKTFTISEPQNELAIAEDIKNVSGFGLNNGKITVEISGGTPAYSYKWFKDDVEIADQTTSILDNQYEGSYKLIVTDSKNCTAEKSFTIIEPLELKVDVSIAKTIDCFDGTGILKAKAATATGVPDADGFYTYKWYKEDGTLINTTLNTEAATGNVLTGKYYVTITDSNDNQATSALFDLIQPTQIIVTIANKQDVTCFDGNDGITEINVTGGTPDLVAGSPVYTYLWSNGSTSQNQYSLKQGTYSVNVYDGNLCVGTLNNIIIDQPQDFGFDLDKIVPTIPTAGNSDGALHIEIIGGVAPYRYVCQDSNGTIIKDVPNSNLKEVDFTNLTSSIYTVSATDATGCTKSTEFDFNNNVLEINITQSAEITCNNGKNAAITAVAKGGFGIRTITWYKNGAKILNESNALLNNLEIGTYYAIVKDFNKVEVTSNSIVITQPDPIVVTYTQKNANCLGSNDATITLTASGGSNNFQYRYKSQDSGYGNWIAFNSLTAVISDLKANTYDIQVQDTKGCNYTSIVNVEITEPKQLVISSKTIIPATGFGLSNGSINIVAQGGTANYSYKWFTAANTLVTGTTATVSNLVAGKYYAVVTDAKGCSITSEIYEVTQPDLLVATIASVNAVLCSGDNNASLKANVTGGIPAYTYKWHSVPETVVLGTNITLGNLAAGTYYVEVTDAKNNVAKSDSFTISQPQQLANTLSADYTLCGDGKDWTITPAVTGGTKPYNYLWNTGARTEILKNVAPGNYTVTVTDFNGCKITKSITLVAPPHLDASETIKMPTCYLGSDAKIVVTPIAGTAPYTYLWNTGEKSNTLNNVAQGEYSVAITDSRGCTITRTYTIIDPPKDVIDLGEDVTLCYKQSLTINAKIDDDKATYLWTSDKGFKSTNAMITISDPANYTVVVTNKLGCQATDTITISSQESDISAEFAMSSQVFVNEKFIIVDISNPKADKVEWKLPSEAVITTNNGDYAEMSFTKAGEYDITINTEKGRCTASQTKTILVTEGEYLDPDDTDLQKKFDLKIYPNPSNGVFTVDVTLDKVMPANIKVYNLNNNVVIDSKSGNGKDAYSFNFNLSGLSSGIYFVLFESQQGTKLRKLIIQ